MEGGITTLAIVNIDPLVRLLILWFEGIPCVVQSTEDAISNHPLLHRSVFNTELQKKTTRISALSTMYYCKEIAYLVGV